jgi:hypothetical protein
MSLGPGDLVRVGPSKPGKRDGFDALVVAVEVNCVHVRHVDVLGRSRFVRPERIVRKKRNLRKPG